MLFAHFPLPRALLSSRRSMLPVYANVAPILPSPLSDVSQVAVNRPQATSHKGVGIPQSGKSGILGFGIQNQRLSLIPLHGAIQWKNQANQCKPHDCLYQGLFLSFNVGPFLEKIQLRVYPSFEFILHQGIITP